MAEDTQNALILARKWRVIAFAGLLLLALIVRLPLLGDPAADIDEQLYHLIGVRMLEGALPYVDIWDRKPIGLFLIYAISAALTGGSILGYQLLAVLFCAIGAALTMSIVYRLYGLASSITCAILYILAFPLFWSPAGQSEVFYLPFVLGMLSCLLKAYGLKDSEPETAFRFLLAGSFLGGISLQIKYSSLPECVFFGLAATTCLWRMPNNRQNLLTQLLALGFLGLLPTALAMSFYASIGHFQDFWFANFPSIFLRGEMAEGYLKFAFLRRIIIAATPLAFFAQQLA